MRIHRYSGRENGLMLIGTASELRQLGSTLMAKSEGLPEKSSDQFPPLVVELNVETKREFPVSVHLDTQRGSPKTNFPESTLRQTILVALAIVGLVALARTLLHAL